MIMKIAKMFPDSGLKSAEFAKYNAVMEGVQQGSYFIFALFFSLILALVLTTTAAILGLDIAGLAAVSITAFASTFIILYRIPAFMEKNRLDDIEAGLPLFLKSFGMLLELDVPFVQAMENVCSGNAVGKEFIAAIQEIKHGGNVQKALANIAKNNQGQTVKKAVVQMIAAYEHGKGGPEMNMIADDFLFMQKYRLRDFASKSSMFGLVFVISATILPTFFLIFSTVGKFALGIDATEAFFMLGFLVFFPLLNILIMLAAGMQMPKGIFFRPSGFPIAVFVFTIALVIAIIMDIETFWKIGMVLLICAISAPFLINQYVHGKKDENLEEAIPDSLLSVSGLPKNYGVDRLFEKMAELGNGFSAEAAKTMKQLKAGLGVEKALDDLWKRNNSIMLKRVCELMLLSHMAGANVSQKMHQVAGDIIGFAELDKDRANALSMQKYTLYLGAVLVPIVLSMALGLSSDISGFLDAKNAAVLEIAPRAVAAYIVIYSAISASYISWMDGRGSGALLNFIIMAMLGLACFYIISPLNL